MSKGNVDLVASVFPPRTDLAAIVRSQHPGAFLQRTEVIDPDLEVTFAGTQAGAPPVTYEGLGGLVEGWQDWLIPYESYVIELEEALDAGDKVVMLVQVRARTSRDGVEIAHSPAAVWTIAAGTITAVTFFLDREQALAFAGIAAG